MKRACNDSACPSLWACWQKPHVSLPETDYLLSFLTPSDELACEALYPERIIRARELFQMVQKQAREVYIGIVAKIGIVAYDEKRTFREILAGPGGCSRWWFHPVSAKNCEYDPTFYFILSIFAITSTMATRRLQKLVLVGAPPELAEVLGKRFSVTELRPFRRRSILLLVLTKLCARFAKALIELGNMIAARRLPKQWKKSFDVVLSSFWDWSVYYDVKSRTLKDRYFVRLPEDLKSQGGLSVGWFAWLDNRPGLNKKGRRLRDILSPLRSCKQIVILQRFLTPWAIFRHALDFGPLWKYLDVKNRSTFKSAFQEGGIDYLPLFRNEFVKGFLDWSIPHGELVASATARACEAYNVRLGMTFQEHFLHSRAVYSGVRRGDRNIKCYTVQHGSYSHNKIYLFFDPDTEFRGKPDGCAVPHPDKVFAMGSLGYSLFFECGYKKEDVYLTGSPRYDSLLSINRHHRPKLSKEHRGNDMLSVLIVCTLDIPLEMDMVEAVYHASLGLDNVRLLLRSHPDKKIEVQKSFKRFSDRIFVTRSLLEEDLEQADVILFTITTVAEEAYLCGKPVWQWLPKGYNGSALAEVAEIPQFSSISGLRRAFQRVVADRKELYTETSFREEVLGKLFYREDGAAAKRIAAQCLKNVRFGSTLR